MLNMAKRKVVALIFVVLGIISAVVSVRSADTVAFRLYDSDTSATGGLCFAILLFTFDYAFAVGYRSGVLGFSLADVNFHMAGPFKPVSNLIMSFGYGLSALAVFIWMIAVNTPFFAIWIGISTRQMAMILLFAVLTALIVFPFTSYLSAAYPSSVKARLIPVAVLIALHIVFAGLLIRELIDLCGSFGAVRALKSNVLMGHIGDSRTMMMFPVAGQLYMALRSTLGGNCGALMTVILTVAILLAVYITIYKRADFDFYEEAYTNAQKIKDIMEASKAGVEAVNTGIARTAKVGDEVLSRGWGASAFFHMHLFENKRSSKLFFINKVALVYRVFALLILFMVDGLIAEELDSVVILTGVVTMLVLNAIVFGGGKTVLEFNRPYLFLVPEKSFRKLAMCLLADIPEMSFDALVCCLMIKIVAFSEFTLFPMLAFILLMVSFDLLSSAVGLLCVRILHGFGKFSVIFCRYIVILALIVIGMIPSNLMAGILVPIVARSMPTALGIIILSMTFVYLGIWLLMVFLSRNILEKTDAF